MLACRTYFPKKSPYKWRPGVDVLRKNTIRLVEVWLDEYAQFYYKKVGSIKGDFGDISERVKLRKDLGCKSFKWYMENIYPEMQIPENLADGWIRSLGFDRYCLDGKSEEGVNRELLTLYRCHNTGGNQFFEYTKNLEILREAHCMEYTEGVPDSLELFKCHGQRGNQEWLYNIDTRQLVRRNLDLLPFG